mmetsp:Transcript_11885/g.26414  ORF Transcript_11885/g.26414 Transcript_11885/m.26414 type:complete len:934 (+) Transcript_11885:2-2803(+)
MGLLVHGLAGLVAAADIFVGFLLLDSDDGTFWLVATLVRVFLVVCGGVWAAKLGLGAWPWAAEVEKQDPLQSTPMVDMGERGTALINGAAPSGGQGEESASTSEVPSTYVSFSNASILESGNERTRRIDSELQSQTEFKATQKRRFRLRNVVLAFLFLVASAASVATAIHLVLTKQSAWVVWCFGASLGLMNLEFALVKRIVTKLTREEGVLMPGLHEHKLYFSTDVRLAFCKVCRERVGPKTGGYMAFQCKKCEGSRRQQGFSVCVQCYRKQLAKTDTSEGLLRGDKGPRAPVVYTPAMYLRRTIRLIRPFMGVSVLAVICVAITQLSRVFIPSYQGKVINALIPPGDHDVFVHEITVFVILSIISSVFGSIQGLSVEIVARRISTDMRVVLFEGLMRQDIAFFDGCMVGQLTSRLTSDVAAVTQPVRSLLNTVFANLILLVGGLIMCFATSWKLTVLAFSLIGPVVYVTGLYARWSRDINLKIRVSLGDANAVATEALRNIRTVRSFQADQVEVNMFKQHMQASLKYGMRDAFASAGVSAATGYLDFAATVLILWYGGTLVLGNEHGLTIGSLITFNLYWNMLNNSFRSLNGTLNTLIRASSAAQRVYEILDLVPDIQDDGLRTGSDAGKTVEFRAVNFTYQLRPGSQVLKSVSFTVEAGTTVAIVGKSGSGKSTLCNLCLRFYDPQAGAIFVNGRQLTEVSLEEHRSQVGVVSQETQVFCRSVLENLTYGFASPEEVTEEDVVRAAKLANAHEFIMELDDGYRSMVGEGGVRLSGGQKQRLAIARALIRRPRLLLLDEATSALDAENEGLVQVALEMLMKEMAGRCTILVIAHRLSTVRDADKIVVMKEGEVVEIGPHTELVKQEGVYAALVHRQLEAGKATLEDSGWDAGAANGAGDAPTGGLQDEEGEGDGGRRKRGKGRKGKGKGRE